MSRSNEIRTCLVCTNVDCASRGSAQLLDEITQRLAVAGNSIQVKSYLCFGACQDGPNMVLYPEGTWYMGVQQSDVDEIIAHIQGGEPVSRLTEKVDPALRDLILDILESGMVEI
ncbi:MAG: hypothetical protein GEU73_07355 [Chloroflexi bacterium]|nr:hypothetical protein [Chloroflexota bacterium]